MWEIGIFTPVYPTAKPFWNCFCMINVEDSGIKHYGYYSWEDDGVGKACHEERLDDMRRFKVFKIRRDYNGL